MLFLICLCNERDVLLFHRFHFQFNNLLKKGDKKRYICVCFEKVMDGQKSEMEERETLRKYDQERKRNTRKRDVFFLCLT